MKADLRESPRRDAEGSRGELSLAELIRFLVRSAPLALALAGGAALAFWGYSLLTSRAVYHAAATLVVTPVNEQSSFRRAPLTVTAYKQLLDSPAILAEMRERLGDEGVLDPGQPLRRGRELRSRLFFTQQGRRQELQAASMIELSAQVPDAELAARSANLWAEVFLEQLRELVTATTLESLEVFEKLYPEAQQALDQLQREHDQVTSDFESRMLELKDGWSSRIAAYQQATLDQVAAHEAETAARLRELEKADQRTLWLAESETLQQAFRDIQERLADIDEELEDARVEQAAIEKALADVPATIRLEKAPPDELMWSATERPGKGTLTTEEVNPVWIDQQQRRTRLAVRARTLEPRKQRLVRLAEDLRQRVRSLEEGIRAAQVAQELLTKERLAGLQKLQIDRAVGEEQLRRQQAEEQSALERRGESEVAHLKRRITAESKRVRELDDAYGDATLARAQLGLVEVRLSTPAVVPVRPEPRGLRFKLLLAFVGGGALGLGISLVRRVMSSETAATAEPGAG